MLQTLFELFKSFALIGVGAYGGGLVTIPLIQHEIVISRAWIGFDEMVSLLAIAQMTPGPIAINGATFVGFRLSGIWGAAVATLAVVLPSILILALSASFLERVGKNNHVRKFREGLQIGVLSLILYATWSYGSVAIQGWGELLMGLSVFLVLLATEGKSHPVVVILASGVLGIFIF